ncbi:Ivy family C-type lysozyme inhibitor [Entomohabitans teleogrylli]|uniref:Ivy family C-type lysozyme inhibitor n=1 Tax=Entomohabitans teleogrylli TaxID=1384589 RepID=UPI00073D677C|nr:Ivy family C-type lysozyme inhibitor [Entomohabitans teleogrylli]
MKKMSVMGLLMMAAFAVQAQDELTIYSLASDSATKGAFATMVKGHSLPAWVTQGATSTPARAVKIDGKEYQVLQSCKPHDCGSERMAVIYSPQDKTLSGVFSTVNDEKGSETLQWLNISDELSIDGKTVLFAALSGSLGNHPDAFNYQ